MDACDIILHMFEKRLKTLQKSLISNKIDALLVSSTANIFYLTGVDYFEDFDRVAYLFVTESNAILFTDGRYIEGIRNKLPKGVQVFLHAELFKSIKKSNAKKIGFEQNLTFAEYKRFKKETGKTFALTELIIEKLRSIKDADEIKNIRAACKLTDKTLSHVLKNIRTNITEKEIAWGIEKFIKENGGELAFDSIVAFGPNAAIPHHKTSNKKLSNKDEFVLLDFGAKVNGYCSDMTRTLLTKNANSKAHEIYETVLAAQSAATEFITTSGVGPDSHEVSASKAAGVANNVLKSAGFDPIPHGLGHGIGIEIHESPTLSPKSKDKLVRNNIFTIEPGIYIPGFGGVRIEDDFLLSDKLEQLTKSPKELVDPD